MASEGDNSQAPAARSNGEAFLDDGQLSHAQQLHQQIESAPPLSSSAVEMNQLPPQQHSSIPTQVSPPFTQPVMDDLPIEQQPESQIPSLDGTAIASHPLSTPPLAVFKGKAPMRDRATSEAIGPNFEDDATVESKIISPLGNGGPSVSISIFLLNGQRHMFRLDQRYLRKRNIIKEGEPDMDPYTISVYTLKELIWRDWRDDWDPRPTNPGAIRLIFFGKLLDDKQTLTDAKFHITNPNVVHMTVKPPEFLEDEENAKGEPGSSRTNGRWDSGSGRDAGCCRCSVM